MNSENTKQTQVNSNTLEQKTFTPAGETGNDNKKVFSYKSENHFTRFQHQTTSALEILL